MKPRYFSIGLILVCGVLATSLFLFLAKKSDTARKNFYKIQEDLESYRKGIWRLQKMDPKQLEWQLASINSRFVTADQLGIVIGELTELAKTSDISIKSISPSEKEEVHDSTDPVLSLLDRVSIEINLVGKYEKLAQFLTQLSSLQNAVMRVERFRLSKEEEASGSLQLSVAAWVYVRKSTNQKIFEAEIAKAPMERKAGKSQYSSIDRDPFTKAPIRTGKAAPAALQGILYDSQKPLALVNGETKGIGEMVNDMKIVEINPDGIVLEKDGQKTKMQLRWD